MKRRARVAVVGAGWAGLAAAANLADNADVVLFEAGRTAGGRARTVASRNGFSFLDNGQHLLLGAYHGVFDLLRRVGAETAHRREAMNWQMHGGMKLHTAPLPAPLHLLWGVLFARNLPAHRKYGLLRHMRALRHWHKNGLPDQTVGEWLRARQVCAASVAQFWQPLVLAALNTPVQTASLRVLANVLADGVWRKRGDSDFCLPNRDLGAFFVEPVLRYLVAHGGEFVPQCRIGRLRRDDDGAYRLAGRTFDAAVLAVAPQHLAALLPEALFAPHADTFAAMRHHAITTVYLRYRERVRLPAVMTGVSDGTAHWLIDRSRLNGANEIAAVISVSEQYGIDAPGQWYERVCADVRRVCPQLGEAVAHQVITEKRATVAAEAGRVLPDVSAWRAQGLYAAGDWLHPRYPATLEAAVQSGSEAARQCLHDWGVRADAAF
ncbi:hydroxysqualene dehydroxylase HpnE [Conchiformibius kuhniae]|uniref:Hydroxysqualene dehydroxylase HpnE n=1 Tax=Conchiformibius kuhniae TaxID=211502 RepID=A0A8T9MZI6_9NEIS|nr:hydroxysqualene dehydroxylase HpnE [Conchiformibius kuhniae]